MHIAYVAGIIDGEGCIQFAKCRTAVFPRILVVNTNRGLLERLQAQFGGDIAPICHRRENWKPSWQWRISWTAAVDLLVKVSPYIEVKLDQMATVFAWDAVRPGNGNRWDQDTLNFLFARMTWLNAKGPTTGDDPVDVVLGAA